MEENVRSRRDHPSSSSGDSYSCPSKSRQDAEKDRRRPASSFFTPRPVQSVSSSSPLLLALTSSGTVKPQNLYSTLLYPTQTLTLPPRTSPIPPRLSGEGGFSHVHSHHISLLLWFPAGNKCSTMQRELRKGVCGGRPRK